MIGILDMSYDVQDTIHKKNTSYHGHIIFFIFIPISFLSLLELGFVGANII